MGLLGKRRRGGSQILPQDLPRSRYRGNDPIDVFVGFIQLRKNPSTVDGIRTLFHVVENRAQRPLFPLHLIDQAGRHELFLDQACRIFLDRVEILDTDKTRGEQQHGHQRKSKDQDTQDVLTGDLLHRRHGSDEEKISLAQPSGRNQALLVILSATYR